MPKPTITTLFSGAGGCDLGAIAAGYLPCEAVEYDPRIAELHKANIGGKCHVMNILDADPFKFEKPDLLHASPVCKSYSAANANKGEKDLDIACAKKTAEFIEVLQPQAFTLENVQAYAKSKAFAMIVDKLYSLGYWLNYQVHNAVDFGVPQSRRRLILMAVKSGYIPPLPQPTKHIGWYEAIADLVSDLDDTELAPWQVKALPNNVKESVLLSQNRNNFSDSSVVLSQKIDPSFTLTASIGNHVTRAILIESTGARSDRPLQTRAADEPCWTLRAMGQDGHYHRANALLSNAKVKALNIACLARLQGFPDDYRWSGKKSVDGMSIGNSVPPPMYKVFAEVLKEVLT